MVSDWEDIKKLVSIHRVAADDKEATRQAVLTGIDMSMVPNDLSFADHLVKLVEEGAVPMARIDQAVLRVLALKERLGLFDDPLLGIEAYEAVSFYPLATESGMLREVLVQAFEHPECELRYAPYSKTPKPPEASFSMLMPEHDKVIFQVRDSEVDRVVGTVLKPIMNRPWPELGGLKVGVDVEVGKVLGRVETWK